MASATNPTSIDLERGTINGNPVSEGQAGRSNGRDYTSCLVVPNIELNQLLKPVLNQVQSDLNDKLSQRNVIQLSLKYCWEEARDRKMLTLGRLALTVFIVYCMAHLVEGVIGGEVLFWGIWPNELFSSNFDVRINAGGLLTNAAANVNFMIDSVVLGGTVYWMLFRNGHRKAMRQIINESYDGQIQSNQDNQEIASALFKLKKNALMPFGGLQIDSKLE